MQYDCVILKKTMKNSTLPRKDKNITLIMMRYKKRCNTMPGY